MRSLLIFFVLAIAPSIARAAPDPFAVYAVPNLAPDVYPVTQKDRDAMRAAWRGFLADDRADYAPQAHVSTIRLVDLLRPDGTPQGGWDFNVVVPAAPSPWKAPDLHVSIGGVNLDDRRRDVMFGSLVVHVALARTQLAPGTYKLTGTRGTTTVFELELVLADGAADDPDPISTSRALDAAAAKRPPFLVAALPTKPDCRSWPPAAGCTRGIAKMWRELFVGTLPGFPHTTVFSRQTKTSVATGARLVHWPAYLVFPTEPAGWTFDDPKILLDGKPVPAPHLHDSDSTALVVELKLIDGAWQPGKHTLRAVDKRGAVLFDAMIDLIR